MQKEQKWLDWAVELQSLAQSALYYCKDKFDIERFERIREISAEMLSEASGLPTEKVKEIFCNEVGFQTPKLDCRLSDFSSKLPYPCRLVHDSKAAAYLELWNHSELDSAVVFLLNRNLGGAIITNRKVHEGSFMHSGVIEHICINSDGPLCYCGNRGCLETYCSANSLSEIAGMSIKEFFEKLRENKEENIKQIWKEYLKHLAFAMRNLNLVVDGPIIISGYLAPYFMDNDLNYLLKQINSSIPFEFPKENLIVGTNGQYTPAIGAALFYVKKFIDGIAPTI